VGKTVPEPESDTTLVDEELPRETWTDHILRAHIAATLATMDPERAEAHLAYMSRTLASEDSYSRLLPHRSASTHALESREHHRAVLWLRAQLRPFLALINGNHAPPRSEKLLKVRRRDRAT